MQIHLIMTSSVASVTPLTTVEQAARIMRDRDVGALPVIDGGKLVGLLTDRDIVVRGVAANKELSLTRVSDLMSRRVQHCFAEDDVEEAAEDMARLQVRRLPVLDTRGHMAGMVALGDIALVYPACAADALHRISGRELVPHVTELCR